MAEAPVPGSYDALVADFAARLPARLRAAAADVAACEAARASALTAAVENIHKLAGSCGIYGYADLSAALAALEPRLVDDADFVGLGAELRTLAASVGYKSED